MNPIRVGFIGSRGHYQATLGELARVGGNQIVGISAAGDSVEPIAHWCGQHGQKPVEFENYERMLAEGGLDLVVVCGPFERHAEMCCAAIERDIHVLTEKPAAIRFDDLERLKGVCARHAGVLLAGMMFSRYEPGFFTGLKIVREGAIGEIRLINARKSYKRGKRPGYYENRETYGGTIPWVGSHAIDWVLWFTGQTPQRVYASHSVAVNGDYGDMESSAVCQLEFAGGLLASVSIDVLRPASAPTHGDDWIRVVGTSGVMEIRPDSIHLINAENDGSRKVEVVSERCLMQDILEHIRGSGKCPVDTPATLMLTDACLRARQAADENRIVYFSEGSQT